MVEARGEQKFDWRRPDAVDAVRHIINQLDPDEAAQAICSLMSAALPSAARART